MARLRLAMEAQALDQTLRSHGIGSPTLRSTERQLHLDCGALG